MSFGLNSGSAPPRQARGSDRAAAPARPPGAAARDAGAAGATSSASAARLRLGQRLGFGTGSGSAPARVRQRRDLLRLRLRLRLRLGLRLGAAAGARLPRPAPAQALPAARAPAPRPRPRHRLRRLLGQDFGLLVAFGEVGHLGDVDQFDRHRLDLFGLKRLRRRKNAKKPKPRMAAWPRMETVKPNPHRSAVRLLERLERPRLQRDMARAGLPEARQDDGDRAVVGVLVAAQDDTLFRIVGEKSLHRGEELVFASTSSSCRKILPSAAIGDVERLGVGAERLRPASAAGRPARRRSGAARSP